MVASQQSGRVDTARIKELIHRKIGHQRAEKYFDQLKKFLALKLHKDDLDKSCFETLGKDNISLHNLFLRSILQNAFHGHGPPQKPQKVEGIGVKVPNGSQGVGVQSLCSDPFLKSPRKCRSPINRDRKLRDRPSPLGPLGKSPSLYEKTVTMQEQLNAACLVEDGEEVEQFAGSLRVRRWIDVTAPLDVSVNVGAHQKAPSRFKYKKYETCQSSGILPDTNSLMSRLQEQLTSEGIGVSLNCANLLNNGLNAYLKSLIKPSLGIARSHQNGPIARQLNQILHGRNTQQLRQQQRSTYASMLDFHVAMESNPGLLGTDRSLQLEKLFFQGRQE